MIFAIKRWLRDPVSIVSMQRSLKARLKSTLPLTINHSYRSSLSMNLMKTVVVEVGTQEINARA